MTAPAFKLPDEGDDLAELEAVGAFPPLDQPMDDAQLDAIASDVCRQLAELHSEVKRYVDAEDAEHERIKGRYELITDPIHKQIERLENFGEELAKRADFGKKKSRKVGNGEYGRRTKPELVRVVDEHYAMEWAKKYAPAIIVEKITERIDAKAAKAEILTRLRADGEVPPGFEHMAETEICFIKPLDQDGA